MEAALADFEVESLNRVWHFAYSNNMKAVGPEFHFLPALKWNHKGERLTFMTPMNELGRYVAKKSPPGTMMTIARLSNYVTESSAETWHDLVATVPMYHVKVEAQTLLYTPGGFLVVEKTLGDEDVFGLRWLSSVAYAKDGMSKKAFVYMMDMMLPSFSGPPPRDLQYAAKMLAAVKGLDKPPAGAGDGEGVAAAEGQVVAQNSSE